MSNEGASGTYLAQQVPVYNPANKPAGFLNGSKTFGWSRIPLLAQAIIAQLAEQLICSQQVPGSNPGDGFNRISFAFTFLCASG